MNYLSKFRTTYLLALLAFVSISACKNSGDLSEQELYSIINEIIADDSLHVDVVCWKFKDLSLTDAMRNHFNKEDIAFMQKQKTLFKDKTIVPNALHWSPRRSNQQYSTFVDSVCNEGIVYHIAFPMVSADRKKVIIEFSEDCNCNMGSTGGKDLYEKRKGHWVKTERF